MRNLRRFDGHSIYQYFKIYYKKHGSKQEAGITQVTIPNSFCKDQDTMYIAGPVEHLKLPRKSIKTIHRMFRQKKHTPKNLDMNFIFQQLQIFLILTELFNKKSCLNWQVTDFNDPGGLSSQGRNRGGDPEQSKH